MPAWHNKRQVPYHEKENLDYCVAMKKKLILISGSPCVGKTAVRDIAREMKKQIDVFYG